MRTLLLLIATLALASLAACGKEEATCETACSNLDACDKMGQESRVKCIVACDEDPDMDQKAIECLSEASCSEIDACRPGSATPEQCQKMCTKIYEECGRHLLDSSGQPIDQGGCLLTCTKNGDARSAQCHIDKQCVDHEFCQRY